MRENRPRWAGRVELASLVEPNELAAFLADLARQCREVAADPMTGRDDLNPHAGLLWGLGAQEMHRAAELLARRMRACLEEGKQQ